MRDFSACPSASRAKVLGNLFLAERRAVISRPDQRLVEYAAAHAGIAISRRACMRRAAAGCSHERTAWPRAPRRPIADLIQRHLRGQGRVAPGADRRIRSGPALSRLQGLASTPWPSSATWCLPSSSEPGTGRLVVTLTDHVDGVQRVHRGPIRLRIDVAISCGAAGPGRKALPHRPGGLHNAIKYAPASPMREPGRGAIGVRLTARSWPGFDRFGLCRERGAPSA